MEYTLEEQKLRFGSTAMADNVFNNKQLRYIVVLLGVIYLFEMDFVSIYGPRIVTDRIKFRLQGFSARSAFGLHPFSPFPLCLLNRLMNRKFFGCLLYFTSHIHSLDMIRPRGKRRVKTYQYFGNHHKFV